MRGHGLVLDIKHAPEASGTIRMGVAARHSGVTVPSYGWCYFGETGVGNPKAVLDTTLVLTLMVQSRDEEMAKRPSGEKAAPVTASL